MSTMLNMFQANNKDTQLMYKVYPAVSQISKIEP